MVNGFFAYPSKPESVGDAIRQAIEDVPQLPADVKLHSWEECRVGGKVVLTAICEAIANCDLFCADVTGVNPNVMFELGYAIARNKRIWLTLDPSFAEAMRAFKQLKVLITIGHAEYENSRDILQKLSKEQPWRDLEDTIYKKEIEPQISSSDRRLFMYMKHQYETEAAKKVTKEMRKLRHTGIPLVIDDPKESSVQALAWYGQNVFSALGVLMHLCEQERSGARIHNARYALVAGLAHGFGKPLLMLAHSSYDAPIDYCDMLVKYRTAGECLEQAREWLNGRKEDWEQLKDERDRQAGVQRQRVLLRDIRLGDHVAENEIEALNEYFVETAGYREAREGRHTIFVGRKGTGKTAMVLEIASELQTNRRNLVCVVKPEGYELDGLVRLVEKYKERDAKGYLVQRVWKFLLYSEIAYALAEELRARPGVPDPSSKEGRLLSLIDRESWAQGDFAVRLEGAVEDLFEAEPGTRIGDFRIAIAEKLHGGALGELRMILGQLLESRSRVAVLIDNLDKAWDIRGNLPVLSEVLLGLFSAVHDIKREFARADRWRRPVRITLTIFLRSDIFAQVTRIAGEQDKLSYSRILWRDKETLLQVMEERYAAVTGQPGSGDELWSRVFCPTVGPLATRQYIVSRVLPRPRDIIFLCNAAIAVAVNRGHPIVQPQDIQTAEKQYSQFGLEMIQVENGTTVPNLEAILYEFAGAREILNADDVGALIAKAGIEEEQRQEVINHLCALSFLGLETQLGEFVFVNEDEELKKAEVLSRNLSESRGSSPRYRINPPFHAFLEIVQSPPMTPQA